MTFLYPRDIFDSCIIGMSASNQIVYCVDLLLKTYMDINQWTYDEALDFFEYNIMRSFLDDTKAPIFMYRDFDLPNIEDDRIGCNKDK